MHAQRQRRGQSSETDPPLSQHFCTKSTHRGRVDSQSRCGGAGWRRWLEPRRLLGLAFTALLPLTAAACGNGGPSEGALQGKSATAVISTALRAYHHQRSVSFVTRTVSNGTTTVQTGATNGTDAIETARSGSELVIQAILVDGVAYVRAIPSFLENGLDLSASTASAYAGKWISLQKGDSQYTHIVVSLSPTEAILQFVPEEPNLKVEGATTVAGIGAIAVSGSPAGTVSPGTTATSTMFVSTTAPYLPISSTLVATDSTGKNIERVVAAFGKWNQKVDPVAPSGATPFASLAG